MGRFGYKVGPKVTCYFTKVKNNSTFFLGGCFTLVAIYFISAIYRGPACSSIDITISSKRPPKCIDDNDASTQILDLLVNDAWVQSDPKIFSQMVL